MSVRAGMGINSTVVAAEERHKILLFPPAGWMVVDRSHGLWGGLMRVWSGMVAVIGRMGGCLICAAQNGMVASCDCGRHRVGPDHWPADVIERAFRMGSEEECWPYWR